MVKKYSVKYPTIRRLFFIDLAVMLSTVLLHIMLVLSKHGIYSDFSYSLIYKFPKTLFGIAAIIIPIIVTLIVHITLVIIKWHDLSHEYEHHKRHPREKVIKHATIDFIVVVSLGIVFLGIISTLLFFMGFNGLIG